MTSKQRTIRLNFTPTLKIPLKIRMRKKPRKTTQASIDKFNSLVQSGAISNVEINKFGRLIRADNTRQLSSGELKHIRKVALLSQEPWARAEQHSRQLSAAAKLTAENAKKVIEFERKGHFSWIHPTLEMELIEGKNPLATLTAAEKLSRGFAPHARENASKFIGRPKELQANFKKQLVFYKGLLVKEKLKEKVIFDEFGTDYLCRQVVKLVGENLVRETKLTINSINSIDIFTVTLLPSGKITYAIKEAKIR